MWLAMRLAKSRQAFPKKKKKKKKKGKEKKTGPRAQFSMAQQRTLLPYPRSIGHHIADRASSHKKKEEKKKKKGKKISKENILASYLRTSGWL
jgi:hypothetical protein